MLFKAIVITAVIILAGAAYFLVVVRPGDELQPEQEEAEQIQESSGVEVVAQGLEVPWALDFLPDGSIIFTERPGRVRMVGKDGKLLSEPLATIPVKQIGEGGLLGIAVHPNFSNNHLVYLYFTYSGQGNNTLNRVARYKLENGKLVGEDVIVDKIPGAANHNGGRIKFGPDNFLYITTGDAENPSQAQDKNSLAGKILRVTNQASSGQVKVEVYSYGHRNPQGLAWDNEGRFWATEHGQSALDELNLIKQGVNYGWPTIRGDEKMAGLENPVLHSGPDITWAPSGAAYFQGSIFFGGLRGETLYEAVLESGQVDLNGYLEGEFGRFRDVVMGPDNNLYITTSNKDGRGTVREGDDKIIRVDPQNMP